MEKINTVEMVRHIRDMHYELLKGKSNAELKAYFKREAELVEAETQSLLKSQNIKDKHSPNTRFERAH